MKPISLTLLTYAVFVLQVTLAPALQVQSVTPHLVLLALVSVVLQVGGRQGLLCAATWGLLGDCLSATCVGPGVIAFPCLALVLQIVRRRSTLKSPVSVALLATLLICGCLAAMTALNCWHTGLTLARSLFIQDAMVSAYTGVVLFGLLLAHQSLNSMLPAARNRPSATVANRWRMLTE